MKKFWDVRRMARSAATAAAMSAIPSCSIAPGRCASRTTSWRSSSATIRCRTRSAFITSGAPGRRPRATSWPSSAPSATPAEHNPATLVPVILDGENCWEYYPDGGVSFLRSLYQGIARSAHLRPVTVGRFLEEHPPVDTLHRLFAGSWISHNFAIWVGHPEDNQAWDCLHAARSFLVAEERSLRHDAATLEKAWNEIYIAEGSDWFWWYGDDHSSALDGLFDHLFRKHLRNVYTLLGFDPPGSLFDAISRGGAHRSRCTRSPAAFRTSRSTAAQPTLNGSTPRVTPAATSAAPWLRLRAGCWNRYGLVSTPSGCSFASIPQGGPAREILAEADRLRDRLCRAFGARNRGDAARLEAAHRLLEPCRRHGRQRHHHRGGDRRDLRAGRFHSRGSSSGRATRSGFTSSFRRAKPASIGRRARGSSSWSPPRPISSESCGKSEMRRSRACPNCEKTRSSAAG